MYCVISNVEALVYLFLANSLPLLSVFFIIDMISAFISVYYYYYYYYYHLVFLSALIPITLPVFPYTQCFKIFLPHHK